MRRSTSRSDEPVYAQIATAIAGRQRKGAKREPVPSVRTVANQFGVSIVTASRAIQVLRERQRGGADESNRSGRWYVALHVTPGPHQVAGVQVAQDGFHALARATESHFLFDTIALNAQTTQAEVQAQLVQAAVRGVYLLPSRASEELLRRDELLLAACDQLRLPVVLIERNLRGTDRPLSHDLVTIHDYEGGRKVTSHLLALERKRIAFLLASPTSSHQERLGGYLSALFEAGQEPLILHFPADTTPKVALASVADQLLREQVDGIVCYHDHAAFGLIMELLMRGVSVPKQVAVAGFDNMAICESFSIGVTSYSFPYDLVAQRAADLMQLRLQNPTAPPVKLVVPGELIVRDSTAGLAASGYATSGTRAV
jgi:LacI family transcriptional regulator